jgi:signal transduction histidine kinase
MFHEQMKLEEHNQELERSLLVEKQVTAENETARQRLVLSVVVVFLILSVGGIIMLWRSKRTIQTLNTELTEKNSEVLAQAEELKASHDEVEAINSNLEGLVRERSAKVLAQNEKLTEYAYFNSHKVRGPLARILGLVNVFSKELESDAHVHYSEMLREAGEELDGSIKEITQILSEEEGEKFKQAEE